MSTQTIKAEIINNVLVAMSLYIMEQQTLTILQNVMQQELVRVNMEEITTLPAERKDDISQRNQYIIQLFLIKKRDLARGTKENYLNAIRRLLTEISTKSLDQMDTTDIDWYLSRYEIRNVSSGGKKNQPSTYNNERRFLSAFFTWMRLEKLITDNPVEPIPAKKVPMSRRISKVKGCVQKYPREGIDGGIAQYWGQDRGDCGNNSEPDRHENRRYLDTGRERRKISDYLSG